MIKIIKKYYPLILCLVLGLTALTIPLIGDFHFESAFLVSLAGCFWAGVSACRVRQQGDAKRALQILGYLYVFGIPMLVHAIIIFCFTTAGLGFWLLLPGPSVFFGFCIGRLLRKWEIPYRRVIAVVLLAGIAFGILAYEFFNFPQVYFYNHVWGYWPGPIYDETIQITSGLLFFRLLTILWILLLWFIPAVSKEKEATWIVILSGVALLFSYTQLTEAGIVSPRSYLQQELAGERKTTHFTIYFDKDHYSKDEINILAKEQEFYLQQITDILQMEAPKQKIESYFYANPWQKKKLVGAKFTSYVPVWLAQDQLHIAKQQIEGSLKHELVHVLAKQFGNKLYHASWSIGLVEGLATAIAPNRSGISTIDQMVVSEGRLPTTKDMEQALSPLGFYGGRSAVNYTTTGSFVKYLLNHEPAEFFKKGYASGDLPSAYGKKMQQLVAGWHRSLESIAVDSIDQQVSRRLFGIPSLFEQQCPHKISEFGLAWDTFQYFMAEEDTARALKYLDKAQSLEPENYGIKTQWAYLNLKAGKPEAVQFEASREDSSAGLQFLYADAFALNGEPGIASQHINSAAAIVGRLADPAYAEALATRANSKQWKAYLGMTYENHHLSENEFRGVFYRTKIWALKQVIEQERWALFLRYSKVLKRLPTDPNYMNEYFKMIHLLGYVSEFDLAREWIQKLRQEPLRSRYAERLAQQEQWITFMAQPSNR